MKKKVLAGLLAVTLTLGGCQSPGTGSEPPADKVTEDAEQAGNEAASPEENAEGAKEPEETDGEEAAESAENGEEEKDASDKPETEEAEAAENGEEEKDTSDKPGTEEAEPAETAGTEEAEPAETVPEKVPAVTPDISDAQAQISLLAASYEEWIHRFEDFQSARSLGVTDLDENGRLEVVIGTQYGGGSKTRFDIWQVSEDKSSLAHVDNDFADDESEPDLLSYSAYDFYVDEGGHHFLAYDYESVTSSESSQTLFELTLQDGKLTHRSLGTLRSVYNLKKDTDGESEETAAEGTDEAAPENGELTEEAFWALSSDTLAAQADARQVWITWMNLPEGNGGTWDTAQVTARLWSAWLGYRVGSDVYTDMLEGAYEGDGDTVISDPGTGPFYADAESDTQPLPLTMLSETANEVSDTDAWFERNGLTKPAESLTSDKWMVYLDKEARTAEIMKEGVYDCVLDLTGLCTVPEDPGDIRLRYAALEGDVLYVSVSRKNSSDMYYKTGFIVAIDLNEKTLLWKSDSTVAGAYNFLVLDGRIFTGYGGTGEEDNLFQIDARTGKTLGSTPLSTAPDYILAKEGVLYVRCYDTDYTFSLTA